VLRIVPTSDLTKTYFLSLELRDASGNVLSRNFYWLSSQPDTRGKLGPDDDRVFFTEPVSMADMTALATLPKIQMKPSYSFTRRGGETIGTVSLSNGTGHLAFMVRLMATRGTNGEEVLPSYWDDNYICLLPGEKRQLTVVFATRELGGATPSVEVSGWNIAK
jgi:exo-1,4-beta-D-glucosaminidase